MSFEAGSSDEGWFFITNLHNNHVLVAENDSKTAGEHIVIAARRQKASDSQLWRHGEDGRIYNKNSGLVLDIAKGKAKAGSDVVQQEAGSSDEESHQAFSISDKGHIHLVHNTDLVLGIKESFFSRRDGLRVHLQDKRSSEKEQRWDFVYPVSNLKRIGTMASLQQETPSAYRFPPDTAFLIKSKVNGQFVSVEAKATSGDGARITLDPLRKSAYETQLWTYDSAAGRLVNKHSGFFLSVEEKDEAHVCQRSSAQKNVAWVIREEGDIGLQHDASTILGVKSNWITGYSSDGLHLHLQKRSGDLHKHQRFEVIIPVYKSTTAAAFPDGWFFIKNPKHGLALAVSDKDHSASQVVAVKIDPSFRQYPKQLWCYRNGFLVNQASDMVLDVRGGCITKDAPVCQYKEKKKDNENQQWELSADGRINVKSYEKLVLSVVKDEEERSKVFLAPRTASADTEEQQWIFVKPVFKKSSVPKVSASLHYAQYPAGYFFVRSLVSKKHHGTLVLTADANSRAIRLEELDREQWRTQLWTCREGALVNFETQLAIDVAAIASGALLVQTTRRSHDHRQCWRLTVDGTIVHGLDAALVLVPQKSSTKKHGFDPVVGEYHKHSEEERWNILVPELDIKESTQVLVQWSVALLKECNKDDIQKSVQRQALWPSEKFYIRANDGLALVPQKIEAFSTLVVRKVDIYNSSDFLWTFRNGYLTHCATGLVLHATENLVDGSHLQIRGELSTENNVSIDERQMWHVKTDGTIVSNRFYDLGLGIVRQDNEDQVILCKSKDSISHFAWSLHYGVYDDHRVLVSTKAIVMTPAKSKALGYIDNPQSSNWFYIRPKADQSLVLATSDSSKGAKLVLAKVNLKGFRRQLWHYRDDGCLANLESDYVMDVAGGKLEEGSKVIQWREKLIERHRKNQIWDLTSDGRIHTKTRLNLVLSPKDHVVKEGVEIRIYPIQDKDGQRWTFSVPVYGRRNHIGSIASPQGSDDSLYVERIGDAYTHLTSHEQRTHITKRVIVRRYGIFPEGEFFIRCAHGKDKLSLGVVQKPQTDVHGKVEYEAALQTLDYKEYKWHLWTYDEGHLINVQTGLALDAMAVQGHPIEAGLRAPLYVRERSMETSQFWSLAVNGEIHQRASDNTVIAPASSQRATVHGAQVGLCPLRLATEVQEGKTIKTLQSDEWMRWTFSKPVYAKKHAVATTVAAISSIISGSSGSQADGEVEGSEEHTLIIKEEDESAEETSSSDDEESEEEKRVTDLDIGDVSTEKSTSAETTVTAEVEHHHKEAHASAEEHTPTGFETISGLQVYQSFPRGYFFIRSRRHENYVLHVIVEEQSKTTRVVLAKIKQTDYASQLWSIQNGRLVNLQHSSYVLSLRDNEAEKRVCLATQNETTSTQSWTYHAKGALYLSEKRTLVLIAKDQGTSGSTSFIDVAIKKIEEETIDERQWDIVAPSFIAHQQEEHAGTKIIEAGKVVAVSSIISAVAAFSWLKHTFQHRITVDNQWPSNNTWFFLAHGHTGLFYAAGDQDKNQVGLYKLDENVDYKRFMWAYIDGSLVNYKYMLRLCLDQSHRWILSDSAEYASQTMTISTHGTVSVRTKSETYYLRISQQQDTTHQAIATSETVDNEKDSLQLQVPVFADEAVEKSANVALTTAIHWVRTQRTTTTTTKTTVTTRRAIFPSNTWFFIKVAGEQDEHLALSVHENATSTGAKLVITKLSYKEYKSQLWTFRNGHLVNFGSKLVIDVQDQITTGTGVIQSTEQGVSSQRWVLNADRQIQLESYHGLSLGYDKVVQESTEVILVSQEESGESANRRTLQWTFTTPVFGKATSVSEASELGLAVEDTTEVAIQIQDQVQQGSAGPKEHHMHRILKDVGLAVTAGAATAAIVGAVHKVADSGRHSDSATSNQTTTENTSAKATETKSTETKVADTKSADTKATEAKSAETKATETKATETKVAETKTTETKTDVTESQSSCHKVSTVVLAESRAITRAWRITFVRRLRLCKTHKEVVETIEEGRQDLYKRLDEHLRVHAIVNHVSTGSSLTESHLAVEQVKELYRARVFETLHDKIKSSKEEERVSFESLEVDSVLKTASVEIDQRYNEALRVSKSTTQSTTEQITEVTAGNISTEEEMLVTVDRLKVTVRYWLIRLHRKISTAQKSGASEEDIKTLVQNAHQELQVDIKALKVTASKHVSSSTSSATLTAAQAATLEQSLSAAFERTETLVTQHVETIQTEKKYSLTEEQWLDYVHTTEQHLHGELKTYQAAITHEIHTETTSATSTTVAAAAALEVTSKVSTTDSVKTISAKVTDTKTRLSVWFSQLTQDITLHAKEASAETHGAIKEDTLAIVEAAQIEMMTMVEETKLVLLTYESRLSHLSVAERRRLAYTLESVKLSILASITQFKQSIATESVTSETISEYATYSFGTVAEHGAITELEQIVVKVEGRQEETVVSDTTKTSQTVVESGKEKKTLSGKAVGATTAVMGAAAAAIAAAAIHHHHQGKEQGSKIASKKDQTVAPTPATTVVVSSQGETVIATSQSHTTKVVKLTEIHDVVREWTLELHRKVVERAKQKGDNTASDIDKLVTEAQEELTTTIERAKHAGSITQEESERFTWVRTRAYAQAVEIKENALRLATVEETDLQVSEQQFQASTNVVLQEIHQGVDQTLTRVKKQSTEVAHKAKDNVDVAIAVGAAVSIKAKSHVALFVEQTRTSVQTWHKKFTSRVEERVKQGGENVAADVAVIAEEAKAEMEALIQKQKETTQLKVETVSTEETELVQEAQSKMDTSLARIQESALVTVSEVTKIVQTTKTTESVSEKLAVISVSANERIESSLTMSETVIGHHIDTVAKVKQDTQPCKKEENKEEAAHVEVKTSETATQEEVKETVKEGAALVVIAETTKSISYHLSHTVEEVYSRLTHETDDKKESIEALVTKTNEEIDTLCIQAGEKINTGSSVTEEEKEQYHKTITSIKETVRTRLTEIQRIAEKHKEAPEDNKALLTKLTTVSQSCSAKVTEHYESIKAATTKEKKLEHKHHARKILAGSAVIAAGTAIAVEMAKKLHKHKEDKEAKETKTTPSASASSSRTQTQVAVVTTEVDTKAVVAVEDVKTKFNTWLVNLTNTLSTRAKSSEWSEKETVTIVSTAKKEFIKIIRDAQRNDALRQKHQTEVIAWLDEVGHAQLVRVQEITVEAGATGGVIDISSRLDALTISTTQEVNHALDSCKQKEAVVGAWKRTTVKQLHKKEVAILDVKSEMSIAAQHATSTLVSTFKQHLTRITARLQQGGEDASKEVAVLIAEARADMAEQVKATKATTSEHLSNTSTKSATVISGTALAGIAASEIVQALSKTEVMTTETFDRLAASVSTTEEKQETATTTLETIAQIEVETTTAMKQAIQSSTHRFVQTACEHHQAGHITAEEHTTDITTEATKKTTITTTTTTTRVQDIKITVRDWMSSLTEKVSVRVKQGGSNMSTDLDLLVAEETKRIATYLEVSEKKVTEGMTVAQVAAMHATLTKVKEMTTESAEQIKHTGVQAHESSTCGDTSLTSMVTVHEQRISETLVQWETITTQEQTATKKEEIEAKEEAKTVETTTAEAADTETLTTQVEPTTLVDIGTPLAFVMVVEYVTLSTHTWLQKLMKEVSQRAKRGDGTASTVDIDTIVAKAKESLALELDMINKKIKENNDTVAAQTLISTIEWCRGMLLQGAAQVQAIGVQAAASSTGSATGGIEQMKPLMDAIELQIKTALERCDKNLAIQVESVPECYDHVDEEEVAKTDKKEKKKTEKQQQQVTKKTAERTQGEQAATIVVKEKTTTKVVSIVRIHTMIVEWFEKLVVDVSTRAQKRGSSTEKDINVIVKEAHHTLFESLMSISTHAGQAIQDKTELEQFRHSLEWAKGMIVQGSTQVKAIGLQAAAAKQTSGGAEQMRPLVGAIQEQIKVELSHYHDVGKESTAETTGDRSFSVDSDMEVIAAWLEHSFDNLKHHARQPKTEKGEEIIKHQARQSVTELSDLIVKARTEFVTRLSQQPLDEASFHYACEHYERSLEVARTVITAEIGEAEQVAIAAYTSGKTESLEESMLRLTVISRERIRTEMRTSITITERTETSETSSAQKGSVLAIAVHSDDEDEQVVGSQDVEFEQQASTVKVTEHKIDTTSAADTTSTTVVAQQETKAAEDQKSAKKAASHHEIEIEMDEDAYHKALESQLEGDLAIGGSNTKEHAVAAALGTGAVAAIAYGAYKKHQHNKEHDAKVARTEKVQLVSDVTVKSVKSEVATWYSRTTTQISTYVDTCETNKRAISAKEVDTIIENARVELDKTLNDIKTSHAKEQGTTEQEEALTFATTVEWIRVTTREHLKELKTTTSSYSEGQSVRVKTELENLALVSQRQVETALEEHTQTDVVIQQHAETALHETKGAGYTVVTVPKETREQVEERTRKEMTTVVHTTQTRISAWLDDVHVRLQETLVKTKGQKETVIRAELDKVLVSAEVEGKALVQEAKRQLLMTETTGVALRADQETLKVVRRTQQQVLNTMDTVVATRIETQLAVVRQTVQTTDVNHVERPLAALVKSSKSRLSHTLTGATAAAVATGFSSSTTTTTTTTTTTSTWTETVTIPPALGEVQAVAFDLVGTVVDEQTVAQVWEQLPLAKQKAFKEVDASALIHAWRLAYNKAKETSSEEDDVVLKATLVQSLKQQSIKEIGSQEMDQLCAAWHRLQVFGDAVVGVRSLKKQPWSTVAISHAFSTRTMMDVARQSCLCWNAQFSASMFASGGPLAPADFVSRVVKELGLQSASQLAVVSADTDFLTVAKQHGCFTVWVNRDASSNATALSSADVHAPGIDVFAESLEDALRQPAAKGSLPWYEHLKDMVNRTIAL